MSFLTLDFLKNGLEDPSLIKQKPTFLEDIKPAIASLNPKNNLSSYGLYTELSLNRNTAYGYTVEHIKLIYQILEKYSRSEIFLGRQVDYPMYSSAVPLALAIYKEVYGIKYSSWQMDYERMNRRLVGKALLEIWKVTRHFNDISANPEKYYENPHWEDEGKELQCPDPKLDYLAHSELRTIALAQGTVSSKDFGGIKYAFPEDHVLGKNNLPKIYWCMLTQTWIFDPRYRHPDMITCLFDWDNPPEPVTDTTLNW